MTRPTLADVATRAGVHINTVTEVRAGRGSPDTQRRVAEAIEALDWEPWPGPATVGPVAIREIAEEAGVTLSMAWRVLRGGRAARIQDDNTTKVLAVAAELGWDDNQETTTP